MVGIEDVAREAGVSIATVSRALRDLPNVAPGTRGRVRAVARDLGYRPNPNAARLASGRTASLGVVVPNVDSWFFGEVAEAAHTIFSEAGRELALFVVAPGEQAREFAARSDLHKLVGGLLLVNLPLAQRDRERLAATGVPAVAVGSASSLACSVRVDEERVGRLAVEHLLALGHRRIGIVGDATGEAAGYRVPSQRRAGAERVLQEAGLDVGDHLFADGGFNVAGGIEAGRVLLDVAAPPTAIFALSDEMALGVIGAAHELGLRVPEDLSVLGVDDHDVSVAVGLTTIDQQVRRQGELGARLLLELLASGEPDRADERVLAARLVLRRTTAARPGHRDQPPLAA